MRGLLQKLNKGSFYDLLKVVINTLILTIIFHMQFVLCIYFVIYINRCFSLEFWYRHFELTFFEILAFYIVINIDEHNERIRNKERFIVLFMWNNILLWFKHCSSSRLWRKKRIQVFCDILSSVIIIQRLFFPQHVINLHQIH